MIKEEWKRISQIVDSALELNKEDRQTYIEQTCKKHPELRAKVTKLLESIQKSGTKDFLEGPEAFPRNLAADFASEKDPSSSSLIGQTIGAYKIIDLIGHGGMGSVFLAERNDGAYDKQVALKLLRQGMDTPSNIARFERERNILAKLDHPNIAHLLDGGVTDNGLPFLVMEYIDGDPLLEYADKNQLTVDDRLELFNMICKAVNHAHKNTIIHRDLKPSNILVNKKGNVKILDFGIAKILESNGVIFETQAGARVLTFGYAAPEQLTNDAITTASDTYTLGVVLYELLVGTIPFNLAEKNLSEIEETIRTKSPQPPSEKFNDLQKNKKQQLVRRRGTTSAQLFRKINGDLDAIILKALRKDADSRYGSAMSFLNDLQRHRKNLPIVARQDSWRYSASKFIKRHTRGLSVAAGFLLMVIAFSAFYAWRITKERNKAQLEAKKAEAVTGFLTDLIEANYPKNTQGDTVTVRQFLNKGFTKIQKMQQAPVKQAEIMQVMGYTYRRLGQNNKAHKLISKAIPLLKKGTGTTTELAKAYDTAGLILRDLGKTEQAVKQFKKAKKALEDANHTSVAIYAKDLRDMAYVELMLDNYDKAEPLIKKAIKIDKKVNGRQSADLAESYHIYASLLRRQRKYEMALDMQKKSFSILQKKQQGATPGKAANLGNLGTIYNHLDKPHQAISYYRKALTMNEKLYGENHWKIATIVSNISNIFLKIGLIDSAKIYSDKTMTVAYQALPPSHPWISNYLETRARIFSQMHQYHKADSTFRKALNIAQKHFKPSHTIPMDILYNWAQNAARQQNLKKSADLYAEAFQRQKNAFGMEDSFAKNLLRHLINTEQKLGNNLKADSLATLLSNN